jgi:hypothetical protein
LGLAFPDDDLHNDRDLTDVTDGNGETVPGFEAKGFIRACFYLRHPNNFLVINDLYE